MEAERGLPTQRAQLGGQRAASPGGGGGGGGGGGLGASEGGAWREDVQAARPPRGVFGGLVGRMARAVRDNEWRVALIGMCHMLEAAGVQQHLEEPYLVNVSRVVGGWQATVTVQEMELIVAGEVTSSQGVWARFKLV